MRVLVSSADAVARFKEWFIVLNYCLSVRDWGGNTTDNLCACALPVSSSQLAVNLPALTTHIVPFGS